MRKLIILLFGCISIQCAAQSFDDYYVAAADSNPGLQAKYKAFEAAMARVAQINSLPDPTFSFGYFISPVETRVGPQRAKFSLSQMFPWFGTLNASEDAAQLSAEAKFQDFLEAKNKLYYDLAKAYYPLYELERWKKIEKENIRILHLFKEIATSKFENGSGSLVDALRVSISIDDAETNLQILEAKEVPLQSMFNSIVNRPAGAEIAVPDTLLAEMPEVNIMRDSIFADNPTVKSLSLKAESEEKTVKAVRRGGLPKFGVGLDYVLVDKRTDVNIPDNGKDALMPMVSVSIPIFRGKYSHAIEEANLMQASYNLQKQDYENTLTARYDGAMFDLKKQRELLQLYRKQSTTAQQSLNLLLAGYSTDSEDFEDLLSMQKQLLQYQEMEATALADYQVALANFNYITAKINP